MDIVITLSDTEAKILQNDILDIEQWLNEAVVGKINQCTKRFLKEWQPKLFADTTIDTIPANEADLIALVLLRKDYKNRAVREAEAEAELTKGG
ncbi:MAG: hypothetical protein HN932_12975 [Candidatus Marinimicrobia bacterium]|jgi:hypothetical protein|nr:hypothetical protein [Candidatus Neomarinimicrobiota bacterium]MBT7339066.1 hypothetical protein [Candidatus Jacksonbacteria bacterium]